MLSRRLIWQSIGAMFAATKSYKISAVTVSLSGAKAVNAVRIDPPWQTMRLSTARYLTIDASINGLSASAVIDTGATRSIISKALAEKLALPVSGSLAAAALTRQVNGTLYRAAKVNVGDIEVGNVEISSFDVSEIERSLSKPLPLVIGLDLLEAGLLEADLPSDRVRFIRSIGDVSNKDFEQIALYRPATRLVCIPLSIEGRVAGEAIIDLGSNVLCSISEDFAIKHELLKGRKQSTTMTAGVEGTAVSKIVSLREVSFGSFKLRNVPSCIVADWILDQPINLGWPFFSAFHFILDTKNSALGLSSSPDRLREPLPRDRSGIGAVRLPDRLLVRHVAENSPAAMAGLRADDEIISINGRKVDHDYPSPSERQGYKLAGTQLDMILADGRTISIILADYF